MLEFRALYSYMNKKDKLTLTTPTKYNTKKIKVLKAND